MGKCDSAYGVANPHFMGKYDLAYGGLLHFYRKIWFSLWYGYSIFMGKYDSAYGGATPFLWENVIQVMVWLHHFPLPTPSQLV